MSKKPLFKDALDALKPNQPYKQPKEKVTGPMQFRAPEPPPVVREQKLKRTKIKTRSDQNNLSSKSAGFNFEDYAPKGKEIELVEKDGEFHIPHRLFEFIHKALGNKVEILVFSCLIRNTLGYRKPQCQISQSFIAKWTGIATPNVRKALRDLEEASLIIRKAKGEATHERSIYEVPVVKAYLRSISGHGAISDQNDLSSEDTGNRDQNNLTSEIKLISNKEIEIKNKENSLSKVLDEYFASCSPSTKREREFKYFETLCAEFSLDDIELCLLWLKANGIPKSKETCYSPMAFLTQGMGQVLALANEEAKARARRQQSEAERIRQETETKAQEAKEAERFEKAKQAFASAFSDASSRAEFLENETKKLGLGGLMPKSVIERMAILDWYQQYEAV